MKKIFAISTFVSMILMGCSNFDEPNYAPAADCDLLYAAFSDETRTYVEEGKYLRWHEDDRITAFFGNTLNRQYKFKGKTGDNSGTFSLIPSGELGTGNELASIYAVYPYDEDVAITDKGVISLSLPATQNYAEESFGRGANTMIAVTENVEDTFLMFRNACGYLKLQLYGEGVNVATIEVKGNNDEKIAGSATTTMAFGGVPTLAMADDATTAVTLDCGDGVLLGSTEDAATEFWVVLPAMTFEKGITITVTDTAGGTFEKSTTNEVVIERNMIQPMSAVEVETCLCIPNNEIWYTSRDGEIVTPNKTEAFGVSIKSNTYENGKGVITFDGEVTSIGSYAFYGCSSLTSATIPDSVTSIGDYTFCYCSSLTSVTIGNSVTSIGNYAFAGCNSLTSITIPDSVTSIGGYAFIDCSSLTSITIPDSVTSIEGGAFVNCSSLTSVTIPDSVTSIGENAFCDCSSLTSITIPDSVTSIGYGVCWGCSSLTSVYCKPTTPPIGANYMFYGNASGRKIYVPRNSVDAYKSADGWKSYIDYIFADPTEEDGKSFNENHCIYYRANSTGGWDAGWNNYRLTDSHIVCGGGGVTLEMKFKMNAINGETYLAASGNLAKDYCDELIIDNTSIELVLRERDEDDDGVISYYNSWKLADFGVSATDLITLRLSGETITINGTTMSCKKIPAMSWSYVFSNYYREYDEGEWEVYEGVPEGSELYYVKMYNANGENTYVGYPQYDYNSATGEKEYYWYSNTRNPQYANDYQNQGHYMGNF